jgi:hypothetical protein
MPAAVAIGSAVATMPSFDSTYWTGRVTGATGCVSGSLLHPAAIEAAMQPTEMQDNQEFARQRCVI